MDLLVNDLSIHGQFPDISSFRESVGRIMTLRRVARNFGREVYSHRDIVNSRINAAVTLFDALQTFSQDEKRALLGWLTRRGPFWEDAAEHSRDHWLECGDEIVTETAVGEAAYCAVIGIDRRLVSFAPSAWEYSPVVAKMRNEDAIDVTVANYWQTATLEAALQSAQPKPESWGDLATAATARFQLLTFAADCFEYLNGHPFDPGVADRILSRLHVLNRLMDLVDDAGQRTIEGHRLYQDHFTGGRAWFSDSSDTEKNEQGNKLTFRHPGLPGRTLFCSWHGKINTPPYRIHFAWPEQTGDSLYVAYIGWHITV